MKRIKHQEEEEINVHITKDNSNIEIEEPILKENPNRFVLFPIQYTEIWGFCKRALASIWTAEEIDLMYDEIDWHSKLTEGERYFISHGIFHYSLYNHSCT